MISQEELEKIKAIYKKKSGNDLSDKDALEMATKLFTLVKAVYSPIPKEEYDMVQKRREEFGNA